MPWVVLCLLLLDVSVAVALPKAQVVPSLPPTKRQPLYENRHPNSLRD